jgi:hypothetical protein
MTVVALKPLVSFFVLAYGLSSAYWIPPAPRRVRTAPSGPFGPRRGEGRTGVTGRVYLRPPAATVRSSSVVQFDTTWRLDVPSLRLVTMNRPSFVTS